MGIFSFSSIADGEGRDKISPRPNFAICPPPAETAFTPSLGEGEGVMRPIPNSRFMEREMAQIFQSSQPICLPTFEHFIAIQKLCYRLEAAINSTSFASTHFFSTKCNDIYKITHTRLERQQGVYVKLILLKLSCSQMAMFGQGRRAVATI